MKSLTTRLLWVCVVVFPLLTACQTGQPPSTPGVPTVPVGSQPDAGCCDLAEQSPALQAAADVDLQAVDYAACHRLQVDVDLDPAPRLAVVQDTRYFNRSGDVLSQLVFRLLANVPGADPNLVLQSVKVGQTDATYHPGAQGTALRIELPAPLLQGEGVDVHLEYQVNVPVNAARGYGTFNYQDGVMLLSGFYAMPAVLENGQWNEAIGPEYGDSTYSEVSLFTIDLTVPATLTVVSTGSTAGSTDNQDSTTTWRLASGPARDFMIVLSDRLKLVSTTVGHVTVNSYHYAEDVSAASLVLEQARNALRAYQQAFGVYPYSELDAVEAPVPGGMEYPGLVLLGREAYRQSTEYLEFLVAHEVAHQWWYGLVGNDQINVPWLDESLANFSIVYYYEHSYGAERAELAFKTYVSDSYARALALGRDAAVNQPVSAFDPRDYGPIVYGKGALFFYHVRAQLGPATMTDALRAYLQRYRFGLSTPDDLLAVLGGTSGENLSQLYEEWIQ